MASKRNDPRLTRDWKKRRLEILFRDSFTCYYCSGEANTVDHLISIKKDPHLAMDPSNLVACCKKCNSSKGARSEAFFLAKKATPHDFPDLISPMPITTSTVHAGPALGQPSQS
jgi:5-methylcytosine-specific restriction endonuclease McrA